MTGDIILISIAGLLALVLGIIYYRKYSIFKGDFLFINKLRQGKVKLRGEIIPIKTIRGVRGNKNFVYYRYRLKKKRGFRTREILKGEWSSEFILRDAYGSVLISPSFVKVDLEKVLKKRITYFGGAPEYIIKFFNKNLKAGKNLEKILDRYIFEEEFLCPGDLIYVIGNAEKLSMPFAWDSSEIYYKIMGSNEFSLFLTDKPQVRCLKKQVFLSYMYIGAGIISFLPLFMSSLM